MRLIVSEDNLNKHIKWRVIMDVHEFQVYPLLPEAGYPSEGKLAPKIPESHGVAARRG